MRKLAGGATRATLSTGFAAGVCGTVGRATVVLCDVWLVRAAVMVRETREALHGAFMASAGPRSGGRTRDASLVRVVGLRTLEPGARALRDSSRLLRVDRLPEIPLPTDLAASFIRKLWPCRISDDVALRLAAELPFRCLFCDSFAFLNPHLYVV